MPAYDTIFVNGRTMYSKEYLDAKFKALEDRLPAPPVPKLAPIGNKSLPRTYSRTDPGVFGFNSLYLRKEYVAHTDPNKAYYVTESIVTFDGLALSCCDCLGWHYRRSCKHTTATELELTNIKKSRGWGG
jgi:hypothetical protein